MGSEIHTRYMDGSTQLAPGYPRTYIPQTSQHNRHDRHDRHDSRFRRGNRGWMDNRASIELPRALT